MDIDIDNYYKIMQKNLSFNNKNLSRYNIIYDET
jgi:hypothetical protein